MGGIEKRKWLRLIVSARSNIWENFIPTLLALGHSVKTYQDSVALKGAGNTPVPKAVGGQRPREVGEGGCDTGQQAWPLPIGRIVLADLLVTFLP